MSSACTPQCHIVDKVPAVLCAEEDATDACRGWLMCVAQPTCVLHHSGQRQPCLHNVEQQPTGSLTCRGLAETVMYSCAGACPLPGLLIGASRGTSAGHAAAQHVLALEADPALLDCICCAVGALPPSCCVAAGPMQGTSPPLLAPELPPD